MNYRVVILSVLFLCFAKPTYAIESTFDIDLDGWTTDNSGTFQHVASGGNPGGFLFLDNDDGINLAHIFAPLKFLGNLSPFDGGTISFDGKLLGSGGTFFEGADDYGVIRITGTTGSATFDLVPSGATADPNSWETFSADLNAANWGGSLSSILTSVTEIRLSVEALLGPEVEGIDNFRISAIPEPSTFALATLSLIGIGCRRRKRA